MFIVRVLEQTIGGKLMLDTWKMYSEYDEVVDYLHKTGYKRYQVFEADNVTEEVYNTINQVEDETKRKERLAKFLELKKEFEPETSIT